MTRSMVWLRRDLRLHDHTSFNSAIKYGKEILPIFIFDTNILSRFENHNDQRLSFIAEAIFNMNIKLASHSGEILLLHGKSEIIIPKIAKILEVSQIFTAQDYEPEIIERDNKIKEDLYKDNIEINFEEDHILIPVGSIKKQDQTAYKVYTAYKKIWKNNINPFYYSERKVNLDEAKFCNLSNILFKLKESGIKVIKSENIEYMLEEVGYQFNPSKYFKINQASNNLQNFVENKIVNYKNDRDYMYKEGTSFLSPYIRFGLISIRECYRASQNRKNSEYWINELIWRDFYKMILYYFPYTTRTEFKLDYQHSIPWENDPEKFKAWILGETGYPLIDAAMRQLKSLGWMHNRMRMVTASFLSKHLLTDWRIGEDYFAKNLLDYDLSSNVGGWQWSASTGNDAQPYFRVFNPTMQAKKFDPEGKYIKKYIPELRNVPIKYLFDPVKFDSKIKYPKPIIEHKTAREKAIRIFRGAKMVNNG